MAHLPSACQASLHAAPSMLPSLGYNRAHRIQRRVWITLVGVPHPRHMHHPTPMMQMATTTSQVQYKRFPPTTPQHHHQLTRQIQQRARRNRLLRLPRKLAPLGPNTSQPCMTSTVIPQAICHFAKVIASASLRRQKVHKIGGKARSMASRVAFLQITANNARIMYIQIAWRKRTCSSLKVHDSLVWPPYT